MLLFFLFFPINDPRLPKIPVLILTLSLGIRVFSIVYSSFSSLAAVFAFSLFFSSFFLSLSFLLLSAIVLAVSPTNLSTFGSSNAFFTASPAAAPAGPPTAAPTTGAAFLIILRPVLDCKDFKAVLVIGLFIILRAFSRRGFVFC